MDGIFAAEWEKFVIPALAVLIWVLTSYRRSATDGPQVNPRPGRPISHPPKKHSHPKEDLEEFLRELGVEDEPQPKPKPRKSAPAPNRSERRGKSRPAPRVEEPEESHAGALYQRHLKSELKARHSEELHSQLEGRGIEIHVGKESIVAEELQRGIPSPTYTPLDENYFAAMLADKDHLTHSFILGQILGPPLGLRD